MATHPHRTTRSLSDIERFQLHIRVDPITGCHNWDGAQTDRGYPHFSIRRTREEKASSRWGNRRVLAHKWLFERTHGKVEPGYEVDHRCCNPSCVNLDHLQSITKAQNLALRGRVHLDV